MLNEKKRLFASILPQLISIGKSDIKKPKIEILEGKEGIKTILNEILRLTKEWYAFNIPGKGPEILGPNVEAFEKERQKKKIKLYVICNTTKSAKERGAAFSKMKCTQVKYLGEPYESPASNYIYSDRVVIIFWYEQFPFAVRIIDKNLAESYKKYFFELWSMARIK
mgnify:CR=1 FL=1